MSKPIEKAARNIASIDATRAGSISGEHQSPVPAAWRNHELVRSEMDVVRRDDRGSADGDLVPMGVSAGSGGAAAGAGPLSEVTAGLRIQESRRQRTGGRAGDLLLQMLVLPQRVHQGHSEAPRPLPAPRIDLRRACERRHREGEDPRRRTGDGRLQICLERTGLERSRELSAGEMLLELGQPPAQPALSRAIESLVVAFSAENPFPENALVRREPWHA